jgi:hypothetical protein
MGKSENWAAAARITAAFPVPPPEVDLRFRPMFGGLGGYVRERIFFVLTGEGAALKFSPQSQALLRAQAPDAVHLSWTRLYLIVPPDIWDDDAQLGAWLERSIDDVLSAPPRGAKARSSGWAGPP